MVLVNGADGIGTGKRRTYVFAPGRMVLTFPCFIAGWSTSIPNYNPKDIVDNLLRMMDGEEPQPMNPWFRGFRVRSCFLKAFVYCDSCYLFQGSIEPTAVTGRYSCNGIANVQEDSSIKVTELPVRLWTDTFRDNLETMRDPKDGKKPEINILVSTARLL